MGKGSLNRINILVYGRYYKVMYFNHINGQRDTMNKKCKVLSFYDYEDYDIDRVIAPLLCKGAGIWVFKK